MLKTASCLIGVLTTLLGCLALASTTAKPPPKSELRGKPIEVLRQVNHVLGPHKGLAAIVRTDSELAKLRMNFRPTVDFTKESAIMVAMGWRSSTGYSIVIQRLEWQDNVLHVYVKQREPNGIAGAFPTSPYSIAIVDKLPANVQLKLHGAKLGKVRTVKIDKPIN